MKVFELKGVNLKTVDLKTVDEMIDDIIRREGGYSNHPNDRGKATKYGITLETLSKWRGRPTGVENVKRLTKTEAADIYRAEYFLIPKINLLPPGLRPVVFDMAVNMGPKQAIKIMQRVIGRIADGISIDGIIGPKTVKAARYAINAIGASAVVNQITDERIIFYRNIVKHNPSQIVFLNGWENRAREFLA
jgi:lysozyme family protein